jgi:hypothetical protein
LLAGAISLSLLPSPTLAQSLCDDLKTMIAAAPQFVSLRGTQTGSEFDGTLKFDGAKQCEIRNKSGWGTPLDSAKWTYECLWNDRIPEALPWLRDYVQACLPSAQYADHPEDMGSFGIYPGGIFSNGDTSVRIEFSTYTRQLWLTVVPAGAPLD